MQAENNPTLKTFCQWAECHADVHGLILIGSQAREQPAADQWSDTDLMVLVSNPATFLESSEWLAVFGDVVVQYNLIAPLHFVDWDWCVKRVLYTNNKDVDFSIVPYNRLDEVLSVNADIIDKGYLVLYASQTSLLESKIAAQKKDSTKKDPHTLTHSELDSIINEILFHVIWIYKKVKRKELWVAVNTINGHLNQLLLKLIENNNALAQQSNVIQYEGRFLEQRTEKDMLDKIASTYCHYDENDAISTLENILDFTQQLTDANCQKAGFPVSTEPFDQTRAIFAKMKA